MCWRCDDGPEVEIINTELRLKTESLPETGPFGIAARARGYAEFMGTPDKVPADFLAGRTQGREA